MSNHYLILKGFRKKKLKEKYAKYFIIFKQLRVNIPFVKDDNFLELPPYNTTHPI